MVKKIVFEIDEMGYVIDTYVADVDENGSILNSVKPNLVSNAMANGLFKPKWNGTEWIEGATQEEIDELTKVEPSPPTETEMLKQRLEGVESALVDLILGGM